MKAFFDSSVLVAAFYGAHVHHERSLAAIETASKKTAFCAAHTLASEHRDTDSNKFARANPLMAGHAFLYAQRTRRRVTAAWRAAMTHRAIPAPSTVDTATSLGQCAPT